MNITDYFQNKEKLEKKYDFFIYKKQLVKSKNRQNLVQAHIKKAEHNIKVLNQLTSEFNDWKIVSIYYALYHSCLALLANKNFSSKNHTATLLFIIKHYSQVKNEELKLIEELQIKEQDAIFYTDLKQERHNANYSTNLLFDDEQIRTNLKKTILFLNKVKEIIETNKGETLK